MKHASLPVASFIAALILVVPGRSALAAWPADGLHVSNFGVPSGMVGDTSGGVFLNWGVMAAQRVSAGGDLLIPNGSLVGVVSAATAGFPDGAGGIYIAYRQDLTISLLRVGPSGNVIWNIPVCQTANTKYGLVACPDETGGALVAWSEDRDLPAPGDQISVYGQRVDSNGTPLWTLDGRRLRWNFEYCPGPGCSDPIGVAVYVIAIAGSAPQGVPGGAQVITREALFWGDEFRDVIVDATGAPYSVWPATYPNHAYRHNMATSDGDGGAYVWYKGTVYANEGLYLDRRSMSGPSWQVLACLQDTGTRRDAVVRATSDGVLIAWIDTRAGNDDVYAQKFSLDGTPLWTVNGVPVCTDPGAQTQVDVAGDFQGGAELVWTDARNGWTDIYAAHVNADGLTLQPGGVPVSSANGSEVSPKLVTDPAGYGIVSWSGVGGAFAQRINTTTVAVAITAFTARVRGGEVVLGATLRSDLGVDVVKVFRAAGSDPLVLHETLGSPGSDHFEYVDDRVSPATTYRYQLAVGDADGEFLSPVQTVTTPGLAFSLAQNQPNPFNPETVISFTLEGSSRVTMDVYSADGRHVRTLLDESRPAGTHRIAWDGTDQRGLVVGSGLYFCRLQAGKSSATRKMLLLK